jgi:hypothetical protein
LFYSAAEAVIGIRDVGKTKASGRGTPFILNEGEKRLVLKNQQVQVGFQASPYTVLRRSRLAKARFADEPLPSVVSSGSGAE